MKLNGDVSDGLSPEGECSRGIPSPPSYNPRFVKLAELLKDHGIGWDETSLHQVLWNLIYAL